MPQIENKVGAGPSGQFKAPHDCVVSQLESNLGPAHETLSVCLGIESGKRDMTQYQWIL